MGDSMKEILVIKKKKHISPKCPECGKYLNKQRELKRNRCDYCWKSKQKDLTRTIPNVINLKLPKKLLICRKCSRELRLKKDKRLGICERCRERTQLSAKGFIKMKSI